MRLSTLLAALLSGVALTHSLYASPSPNDEEGQLLAAIPHYQRMWNKDAKQILTVAERVLEKYRIKTDVIDRENGVLVTATAPLRRIPEADVIVPESGARARGEFVLYLFVPTWQSPGVLEANSKIFTNAGGGNYKQVNRPEFFGAQFVCVMMLPSEGCCDHKTRSRIPPAEDSQAAREDAAC